MQLSIRLLLLAGFCLVLGVGCSDSASTTGAVGTQPGGAHQSPTKDKKLNQAPPIP